MCKIAFIIRVAVYRTDHLISLELPLLYILLISNHFFVSTITWKWLNQMPSNLAHICLGISTKHNNAFNYDLHWWRVACILYGTWLFSKLDSTFPSFASNISAVLASFTLNFEYVVAETISYLKFALFAHLYLFKTSITNLVIIIIINIHSFHFIYIISWNAFRKWRKKRRKKNENNPWKKKIYCRRSICRSTSSICILWDTFWAEQLSRSKCHGASVASGEANVAEQLLVEQLSAEQLSVKQMSLEQVSLQAEQMSAEQLSAEQLSAEQMSAEQLSAEQMCRGATVVRGAFVTGASLRFEEQLSAEQLSAEQMSAEQLSAEQMSAEQMSRSICRRSKCRRSNCRRSKCRGANVAEQLSRFAE